MSALFTPVQHIDLVFDGDEIRPWRATVLIGSASHVYGMALFEVWADSPAGVIDDLLSLLDTHSFEVASDLTLAAEGEPGAPIEPFLKPLARMAQLRGWQFHAKPGTTD